MRDHHDRRGRLAIYVGGSGTFEAGYSEIVQNNGGADVYIRKSSNKASVDVNPFADSAALKTAVNNCLRAVPSGLDCCKPKSEGGGGADCGAGGHAAIGDWDVSQVTSMDDLFHGQKVGKEFNQDISKWDVSKVTNMQYMFFHSAFDQDITGWNTASLPNDHASYRMFTGDGPWYQKYGRVGWSGFGDMNGPPSAWHITDSAALKTAVKNCLAAVPTGLDCCKPKSEGGGGADCGKFGHAAIGDWDVSQVTLMDGLFDGREVGKEFNQDISKWDVSKVTNMKYMFFHSAFDQDITGWNTASLPNDHNSYRMFTGDSPWYQKYGRAGWSGSGDMNGPPSAWHIKAKAAGT